jgi:hypothetical protein
MGEGQELCIWCDTDKILPDDVRYGMGRCLWSAFPVASSSRKACDRMPWKANDQDSPICPSTWSHSLRFSYVSTRSRVNATGRTQVDDGEITVVDGDITRLSAASI